MITRLVWTTWTPISAVPQKAVKLNSLTHALFQCVVIGLHSTGEARTLEQVEELGGGAEWLRLYCKVGGELNDFVSPVK